MSRGRPTSLRSQVSVDPRALSMFELGEPSGVSSNNSPPQATNGTSKPRVARRQNKGQPVGDKLTLAKQSFSKLALASVSNEAVLDAIVGCLRDSFQPMETNVVASLRVVVSTETAERARILGAHACFMARRSKMGDRLKQFSKDGQHRTFVG